MDIKDKSNPKDVNQKNEDCEDLANVNYLFNLIYRWKKVKIYPTPFWKAQINKRLKEIKKKNFESKTLTKLSKIALLNM